MICVTTCAYGSRSASVGVTMRTILPALVRDHGDSETRLAEEECLHPVAVGYVLRKPLEFR